MKALALFWSVFPMLLVLFRPKVPSSTMSRVGCRKVLPRLAPPEQQPAPVLKIYIEGNIEEDAGVAIAVVVLAGHSPWRFVLGLGHPCLFCRCSGHDSLSIASLCVRTLVSFVRARFVYPCACRVRYMPNDTYKYEYSINCDRR